MSYPVKRVLRIGVCALAVCLVLPLIAGVAVSMTALKAVEKFTDSKFSDQPWELLGDTRGTYLPGYGAVFTFEMSLVNVSPLTPFHMTVTEEEKKSIHDRKLRQLVVLRQSMHELIVRTASTLTDLPPAENIVFEAHLLDQPFENHEGLPWRVAMTVQRQKILAATARHARPAELDALIEERKE